MTAPALAEIAGGEIYEYSRLVKTLRTARRPRHQIVAHRSKVNHTEYHAVRSWQDLNPLLSGQADQLRGI